jgi:hypothetical protein
MAALQSKRLGGLCNVPPVPLQFPEHLVLFKSQHAFGNAPPPPPSDSCAPLLEAEEPAPAPGSASSTSSAPPPPPQAAASRSTTLRNSRILPGHAYFFSASIAPSLNGTGFHPFCALTWRTKCSTSAGRSSGAGAAAAAPPETQPRDDKDRAGSRRSPPVAPDCDAWPPPRAHPRGRLVRADALHLALFQHAQQLGLHGRRHVANLIQKQRSAMRLLKLARMPLRRAGERTLLVPEEFALNQLRGNRRAVQRDKRSSARGLFSCRVRATSSLPVPSRHRCRCALRSPPRAQSAPSRAAWSRRRTPACACPRACAGP